MSEINKQKEGLPQKIALIICNGNPPPAKLLHQLWQEADYQVAADGGANQLYRYNLIPDAVVGDFDSIIMSFSLILFLIKNSCIVCASLYLLPTNMPFPPEMIILFIILFIAGILLLIKNKSYSDDQIKINSVPKVVSIFIGSVIGFFWNRSFIVFAISSTSDKT